MYKHVQLGYHSLFSYKQRVKIENVVHYHVLITDSTSILCCDYKLRFGANQAFLHWLPF